MLWKGLRAKSFLMNYEIVDIKGLANKLCASTHTLKKNWRSLPHFFIGDGRNLKGARFNVPEVIEHLRKEANHVSLERSSKEGLDCKIQMSEKTIQERGISDKVCCNAVGGRKTQQSKKSSATETDPFNLLAGVDNVS
jgi:hypothetical protein